MSWFILWLLNADSAFVSSTPGRWFNVPHPAHEPSDGPQTPEPLVLPSTPQSEARSTRPGSFRTEDYTNLAPSPLRTPVVGTDQTLGTPKPKVSLELGQFKQSPFIAKESASSPLRMGARRVPVLSDQTSSSSPLRSSSNISTPQKQQPVIESSTTTNPALTSTFGNAGRVPVVGSPLARRRRSSEAEVWKSALDHSFDDSPVRLRPVDRKPGRIPAHVFLMTDEQRRALLSSGVTQGTTSSRGSGNSSDGRALRKGPARVSDSNNPPLVPEKSAPESSTISTERQPLVLHKKAQRMRFSPDHADEGPVSEESPLAVTKGIAVSRVPIDAAKENARRLLNMFEPPARVISKPAFAGTQAARTIDAKVSSVDIVRFVGSYVAWLSNDG